jgi:protein-tyrosine phosphatase
MEKIVNFRPLAKGLANKDRKRIRENTILRSGELANASDGDIHTLASYGVRYIYDFRSAAEVKRSPALPSSVFTTLHLDVIREASPFARKLAEISADEGIGLMASMYGSLVPASARYKPAVESILKQETDAFLYHCTAGKDRTGIFSAILMMAMDFDTDAIREEYMRINAPQMEVLKAHALRQMSFPESSTSLDFMFAAREEYIDAYLGAVTQTHGSADAYLSRVLGITADTKRVLQQKYLV